MTCCLTTTGHCLNRFWSVINEVLSQSPEGNLRGNVQSASHYNVFENNTIIITAIFPRVSWVKCESSYKMLKWFREILIQELQVYNCVIQTSICHLNNSMRLGFISKYNQVYPSLSIKKIHHPNFMTMYHCEFDGRFPDGRHIYELMDRYRQTVCAWNEARLIHSPNSIRHRLR